MVVRDLKQLHQKFNYCASWLFHHLLARHQTQRKEKSDAIERIRKKKKEGKKWRRKVWLLKWTTSQWS